MWSFADYFIFWWFSFHVCFHTTGTSLPAISLLRFFLLLLSIKIVCFFFIHWTTSSTSIAFNVSAMKCAWCALLSAFISTFIIAALVSFRFVYRCWLFFFLISSLIFVLHWDWEETLRASRLWHSTKIRIEWQNKNLYMPHRWATQQNKPCEYIFRVYRFIFIELCTLLARFTHTCISHKSFFAFSLRRLLAVVRCVVLRRLFFFSLSHFILFRVVRFYFICLIFWWCLCFHGMQWQWNMNKNTAKQQQIMTRIVGWWPMFYVPACQPARVLLLRFEHSDNGNGDTKKPKHNAQKKKQWQT